MNIIIKTLKELNINEQSIKELFEVLTKNPMMAMGVIGKMGLPAEKLQEIMGMIMSNPGIIKEAVEELGLDFSAVEKAKEVLNKK
ncbi:MAG: DUF2999 family protein [Halobacteriovoraceae bacterium]|jgi:hypothetical protein|nr:DUF2999 family protein [Halobacteriovoraceae bacterium]